MRPISVLRALTKPLTIFTSNLDETQQGPENLKEIVPLLGQGLSLMSSSGPADIYPGKYRELLEAVEQPQTKVAVLKLSSFGHTPILRTVLTLLTLTDFMGCCRSYSSPRLLQEEMNGNLVCQTGPIRPRRAEYLGSATCLSILV